MLRVLGHPTAACDGITRRDLLRAGSLAALTVGSRPSLGGANSPLEFSPHATSRRPASSAWGR